MSYIVLLGRWHKIIVSNAHTPSEKKSNDSKESFYEELEQALSHFPKYHTKILLGVFNVSLGREETFKPAIGNERLH